MRPQTTVPEQFSLLERCSPVLFGLLACLLALPALRAGLIADDYFHRMVLLHRGEMAAHVRPVMDLFAFVKQVAVAERMREIGYLPWWSDPGIHIALFRPLTALTHVLDYRLWPDNFVFQHLHSLLWFAFGVATVALLYRAVPGSSKVAVLLAGLFFAVDETHSYPAGWLANRNALLCLVFIALTLLAHVRWRLTGRNAWLAAGLLVFAVGLGCGEATIGALGYIAAWQLTMEKRVGWKRAGVAVLPYLAIALAWRLIYELLGFGTGGSRLYVDPGQHPMQFVRAAVERWPIMAAGAWLPIPIDLWILLNNNQRLVLFLACLLVACGVYVLLRPLLRKASARFWALGMVLSLVPVCAAFPMDRLLICAGIGGAALLALLVDSCVLSRSPAAGRWRKITVIVLVIIHGPLSAFLLTVRSMQLTQFGNFFVMAARQNPTGPEITRQAFVYVNGNDFPIVYGRVVQVAENLPAPGRIVQLSSMTTANYIRREDANTLVVTPEGGFLAHSIDRLLASDDRRFRPGERVSRPDFDAEVLAITNDGRPASVAFRFRRPLEDATLRWLCWRGTRLVEFRPPRIGESTYLPAVRLF